MTNIELIHAINNAIAAGKTVKAGGYRIVGAYPQGRSNHATIMVVYKSDPVAETASVHALSERAGVRAFVEIVQEQDVNILREAIPNDRSETQVPQADPGWQDAE